MVDSLAPLVRSKTVRWLLGSLLAALSASSPAIWSWVQDRVEQRARDGAEKGYAEVSEALSARMLTVETSQALQVARAATTSADVYALTERIVSLLAADRERDKRHAAEAASAARAEFRFCSALSCPAIGCLTYSLDPQTRELFAFERSHGASPQEALQRALTQRRID